MGVVGGEVQVNRTHRRVDAQIEVVAAHVRVGQNVLVTHIGHAETDARLTAVHAQDGSVLGGKTCAEEGADIILVHGEGALNAVEILHQLVVGLGTPAHVGT